MEFREPGQQPFALGQKTDLHYAVVARGALFPNQAATLGALHQTHHGVMPLLQEFGQFADRRPAPSREAGHAQQQLVLLRRKPLRARCPFAEAQEFPKSITKFRKLVQAWQAVRFRWP